jgi:hypothetical protein
MPPNTMVHIRIADPADWPAIEAFLLPRMTSSQFLIGNARAAGGGAYRRAL